MPSWYAAFCEPQKEPLANDQLVRRGFETLFPHFTEWRGLGGNRTRIVRKAYYPNYLFVLADSLCLSQIPETPGVMYLLHGADTMPVRLPQAFMDWLWSKVDHLGTVHVPTASRSKFGALRGKRVQVTEGNPFWGLIGTVLDVDGDAAKVILKMLGADREVRLRVAEVDEIAPRKNGGSVR